jgi:sugar phosphate isomerase/epimerase
LVGAVIWRAVKLALQLHTLRNVGESLSDRIDIAARAGYAGVQFARATDAIDADVASTLDRTGIGVAGAHVGLSRLEDSPAETVERYASVGCDQFVVPSYDEAAFQTRSDAEAAGQHLSAVADGLTDHGASLHYHNHAFEFPSLDGEEGDRAGETTGFDAFAAAADGVGLEIDTGLAHHGGADPVALLERYAERVDLVHFTDSRRGSEETLHVDVDDGEVDVEACVQAASDANVEWLIFEHGLSDDPIASIERAFERLDPLVG